MKWCAGVCVAAMIVHGGAALAQSAPAPSQVLPPPIAPPPPATRITLPQIAAGAAVPDSARKLKFVLTGVDVEGEFDDLSAVRRELAAALVGKTISVADLFELSGKLQQAYVRAGFPLVRVVILPQELDKRARVKLRVIDGYVER